MKFYNFYQLYKDYFATIKAKSANRIFFATSFFQNQISFCCQQYKQKQDVDSSIPVTWDEFKIFLSRNLGNFQVFVDNYLEKIMRDSQY